MNSEKREAQADSAPADEATEVLPAQHYSAALDGDPTVVLPARPQQGAGHKGGSQQIDATAVLPAHRGSLPATRRPSATQPAVGLTTPLTSGSDPTQMMPAAQPAGSAEPTAADRFRSKLSEKAAAGSTAARTGFSTLVDRAKETAQRVKQERLSRQTEKQGQKPAASQQAPLPQPFPPRGPAFGVPSAPQQQNHLMFGGRMSNQQAAPLLPRQQTAPVTSAENSPSGRLQMLTPSHIRQTRPSLWTLLQHVFAAGSMMFLFLVAVIFFVMTAPGQQLDEISFQEFSYQFMVYTQQTSSLLELIPVAAGVIAAIGIIFVLVWKHRFLPALVGLGMAAGANLTTQLLKNFFIVKPDLGIQEATLNSAPSGHTTFAAAAGLALFLASPKRFRPTVALFSMFFSVAAGYSTVINGWHRPSDVVTAILVTGLWAVVGLIILRFMRSEELDMSNTQRSGLILVPLLTITGFFVGFCALALYAVTWFNPIPGSAFVAALCLIAAVAALTTSMQIALLRPQNKQRSAYRRVWAY